MGRPKKTTEEPLIKSGQRVMFIGYMNQPTEGIITKRKGIWMIETKDLYYFLNEVELLT